MPDSKNCDPPPKKESHRHHFGLALIAAYKIFKGLALLAATVGLLRIVLKGDLSLRIEHWITAFRLDPENHYLHSFLVKVAGMDRLKLEAISAGSFIYSALLLTEGIGLWFERTWAETLTIVATASFIPFEVYHLAHEITPIRLLILALNLAIVWYLIRTLRRSKKL